MKKTTLCYIFHNGKVLLMYRNKKKNDVNGGKWVGVGGKFLPGETAEQCLLREVKEETGLELTSWKFRGVVEFISDIWEDEEMFLYSADAFTGTLTQCDEGELHWIPEDQVLDLKTWEGDRQFLVPLMRGDEWVELTLCYKGDELVSVSTRNTC